MKGCRALTNEEIVKIEQTLIGTRNKCLFILGVTTGLRISELISLKVKSVFEHGQVASRVSVTRANVKGKIEGRSIALTERAKLIINDLIKEESLAPDMYLFTSRKGGNISRKQAWRILNESFNLLKLQGKVSTHSMRKSLAKRIWEASGKDIRKTQFALGHRNVNSTISYIGVNSEEIDTLVLGIDSFKAN
jgi:site-specific recombinase XerD